MKTYSILPLAPLLITAAIGFTTSVQAADLIPTRDTSIRSGEPDSVKSGNILVGPVTGGSDIFRGLIEFDLSSYSGMNFSDLSLTMTLEDTDSSSANLDTTVGLHLLSTDFASSEATWNDPDGAGGASWGSPGAEAGTDYTATALSTFTDNAGTADVNDKFVFTDSTAFRDAMNAAAGGSIAFILISEAEEGENRALFRFAQSTDSQTGDRPTLSFTATPVPEPKSYALLLGVSALLCLGLRRKI